MMLQADEFGTIKSGVEFGTSKIEFWNLYLYLFKSRRAKSFWWMWRKPPIKKRAWNSLPFLSRKLTFVYEFIWSLDEFSINEACRVIIMACSTPNIRSHYPLSLLNIVKSAHWLKHQFYFNFDVCNCWKSNKYRFSKSTLVF
jgi:hypothetical protein